MSESKASRWRAEAMKSTSTYDAWTIFTNYKKALELEEPSNAFWEIFKDYEDTHPNKLELARFFILNFIEFARGEKYQDISQFLLKYAESSSNPESPTIVRRSFANLFMGNLHEYEKNRAFKERLAAIVLQRSADTNCSLLYRYRAVRCLTAISEVLSPSQREEFKKYWEQRIASFKEYSRSLEPKKAETLEVRKIKAKDIQNLSTFFTELNDMSMETSELPNLLWEKFLHMPYNTPGKELLAKTLTECTSDPAKRSILKDYFDDQVEESIPQIKDRLESNLDPAIAASDRERCLAEARDPRAKSNPDQIRSRFTYTYERFDDRIAMFATLYEAFFARFDQLNDDTQKFATAQLLFNSYKYYIGDNYLQLKQFCFEYLTHSKDPKTPTSISYLFEQKELNLYQPKELRMQELTAALWNVFQTKDRNRWYRLNAANTLSYKPLDDTQKKILIQYWQEKKSDYQKYQDHLAVEGTPVDPIYLSEKEAQELLIFLEPGVKISGNSDRYTQEMHDALYKRFMLTDREITATIISSYGKNFLTEEQKTILDDYWKSEREEVDKKIKTLSSDTPNFSDQDKKYWIERARLSVSDEPLYLIVDSYTRFHEKSELTGDDYIPLIGAFWERFRKCDYSSSEKAEVAALLSGFRSLSNEQKTELTHYWTEERSSYQEFYNCLDPNSSVNLPLSTVDAASITDGHTERLKDKQQLHTDLLGIFDTTLDDNPRKQLAARTLTQATRDLLEEPQKEALLQYWGRTIKKVDKLLGMLTTKPKLRGGADCTITPLSETATPSQGPLDRGNMLTTSGY